MKGLEGDALERSLERTCAAADEMLSRSIDLISSTPGNTTKAMEARQREVDGLGRKAHALCLCYPTLLQAVNKLSVRNGSKQLAFHAVVLLFQNILGHLHASAAIQAGTTGKSDVSAKRNRQRTIKQQSLSTSNLNDMCIPLTKLAIRFFEALDLSQQRSHQGVLEGVVCVFLDHLGSSLSLIVFADVNAAASKAAQLGLLPPRGLLDTSTLDQSTALGVTQHEACYLVTILRHLMLCIDKQQSPLRSELAPHLTLKRSLGISNGPFVAKVREKLQNTLLRGIFGEEDESFRNALRKPVINAAENDIDIACNGQEEPGDWFLGEVWRLLGWNILTEQNGV